VNLLCVDIGNTNIVIGNYNGNQLIDVKRIETDHPNIEKELDLKTPNYVAISSVVPSVQKQLVKGLVTKNLFLVSHLNSNIKLHVEKPEDVGNDRICNIKAVIEKNLYPSIIVDFGSATTYDVVNDSGHFIGGVIAPGIDVSAEHLFNRAEQLKKVPLKFPKTVIGKNTITNLQSGIMYGGIDAINGMLYRIKKEMNDTIKHIVLTGGFSTILSENIIHPHLIEPSLTLKGIKLIWEENYKKINK
jgi:type III pantothenate kinase